MTGGRRSRREVKAVREREWRRRRRRGEREEEGGDGHTGGDRN